MVDRRLGRGLDFFLSGGRTPAANPTPPTGEPPVPDQVLMAQVKELVPSPYQPRKNPVEADLESLASSIRESGLLQPILVRKVAGKFEIVAGERRWRAAQIAGLERVPVLVRGISDDESAVFALVENIQREDLNAIEKAHAFHGLMSTLKVTQEALAKRVGMERSTVANFLRLLDLPEHVQEFVSRGTLSMGHARALLGLSDGNAMNRLAEECIKQAWPVRRLEGEVKALQAMPNSAGSSNGPVAKRARPVWLNELEEALVDSLATPVRVRYGRKRSQIVIECAGRDEFERVFQRLKNA
jgi:ParB family chromosome partitioning protein